MSTWWPQLLELLRDVAIALGLKPAFVSGVIGAIVSLKFLPDLKSGWSRLTTALSGALCANYCAPLAVSFFSIQSPGGEASVAFLIGLFAMSCVAACIKLLGDGLIGDILKKRFGGGDA